MTSDPRVRLGHRSAGGLEKWADVTVHRSTDAAFTGLRRGSFRLLAAHPDPDAAVAIPVLGMVDPLNVSVAAAPIVYEAMRQRREAGMYAERRIPDACFERLAFEWTHPAVAAGCRRQDLPCPAMDENGAIIEGVGGNHSTSAREFFARVEGP